MCLYFKKSASIYHLVCPVCRVLLQHPDAGRSDCVKPIRYYTIEYKTVPFTTSVQLKMSNRYFSITARVNTYF